MNYFATVSSEIFDKSEELIMRFKLNLIKWQIRCDPLRATVSYEKFDKSEELIMRFKLNLIF